MRGAWATAEGLQKGSKLPLVGLCPIKIASVCLKSKQLRVSFYNR